MVCEFLTHNNLQNLEILTNFVKNRRLNQNEKKKKLKYRKNLWYKNT